MVTGGLMGRGKIMWEKKANCHTIYIIPDIYPQIYRRYPLDISFN